MLIWTNCELSEQGPGSAAALNLNWTPRSVSQLRVLVALRACAGLDRKDVDWFAGVSNGPALMRTLHDDGFYLPCDLRPFVAIGSMPRSHDPAARQYLGQYWLTHTGRQILELLRSPGARFVVPIGGFDSFDDACTRRQELFGQPGHEVDAKISRRPATVRQQQPKYHSVDGLAHHGRSIW